MAAIMGQGFDSLAILASADDKDIDGMIKNVRDTRQEMGAAAPGNVSFTFLATKRFKVLQFWAKELVRCNRPLNIALFVEPLIGAYLTHYEENQRREDGETIEPEKRGDLTDLDKWEVWFERFDTYCSNIYGAAKSSIFTGSKRFLIMKILLVFGIAMMTSLWLALTCREVGSRPITSAFMMNSRRCVWVNIVPRLPGLSSRVSTGNVMEEVPFLP